MSSKPSEKRQVVRFAFYKLDSAWRRLSAERQASSKIEFGEIIESFAGRLLLRPYGLVGIRGDCDFLLWQVAENLDALVALQTALNRTDLGAYLTSPYSYLAMTRRSIYEFPEDPSQPSRLVIRPSEARYLFVYPFIKTRAWYMLAKAERQTMMDEHVRVGRKYPSIRLNTTYSYGLDDQEFIVAFEGDNPADFLERHDEFLVVEPVGIRRVQPDGRILPPDADVLVHHRLALCLGKHVPRPCLDERVHEEVARFTRPDHEARRLARVLRKLIDRAPGHSQVAVRAGQICAQVRAIERRLEGYDRIEVLGHLPEQEVAVTPDPHQAVGAEQQPAGEAFDHLAELDLRARLALGGQPPPCGVELVEREADDLAAFGRGGGWLGAHGAKSITSYLNDGLFPIVPKPEGARGGRLEPPAHL